MTAAAQHLVRRGLDMSRGAADEGDPKPRISLAALVIAGVTLTVFLVVSMVVSVTAVSTLNPSTSVLTSEV